MQFSFVGRRAVTSHFGAQGKQDEMSPQIKLSVEWEVGWFFFFWCPLNFGALGQKALVAPS